MTAVERLIATARREIGYLEKASNANLDDKTANAGRNNWTKYARDLDAAGVYNFPKNGYAWCDIFVDWCFIQSFGLQAAMQMTGQTMKGYGAGCTESARYYRNIGRFYQSTPRPGDQIFFTADGGKTMYHTGIVSRVENGRVFTIEGNTSGVSGVVENGGSVCDKSYSITYAKIGGYGRPDYSAAEEESEMTQEQFDKMMADWLKRQEEAKAEDWSEDQRKWAEENGIIYGDSQGKKMYRAFCTREQMVVFLYRLAEKLGLTG